MLMHASKLEPMFDQTSHSDHFWRYNYIIINY